MEIERTEASEAFDASMLGVTYFSELLSSTSQLTIQGLAVEAMLSAEHFVAALIQQDRVKATRAICVALRLLAVCVSEGRFALGFGHHDKPRKLIEDRHKLNRAMKEKVVEWDRENGRQFSAEGAADRAFQARLEPVTQRTYRKWILAGRKEDSA